MPELDLLQEAQRQLGICNACRYCEGYCAVFPALERKGSLGLADVSYLANLCHDCRACFQACPYTPPHEFAVSIPALLSDARASSYERHARPRRLATAFERSGRTLAALSGVGLLLVLLAAGASGNLDDLVQTHRGPGSFYRIVPHLLMAIPFLVISVCAAAVLAAGFVVFWREAHGPLSDLLRPRAWAGAAFEAMSLRWLGGGGGGCYYPEGDRASSLRRVLHSLVFYGFLSAFVATAVAAVDENFLDHLSPYRVISAPVLFGSVGGVAMVLGTTGFIYLKASSEHALAAGRMARLDYAFLVALDLVAITGLLTLVLRGTPAMGVMLVLHLALLVALYLTLPYGKFVHAVYRYGALVKNRIDTARESAA